MIHNPIAEQTCIGCLLSKPELMKWTRLRPEHFDNELNRWVMEAMHDLDKEGKPCDLVHVTIELQDRKRNFEVVDLTNIARSVPTVANFQHYENLVIESWQLRSATNAMSRYQNAIVNGAGPEVLYQAAQELTNLYQKQSLTFTDKTAVMHQMLEVYESDQPKMKRTGNPDWDRMTGGINPAGGDLIILAARPSMGKTAFALDFGWNASQEKILTYVFSLEMGEEQLLERLYANVGSIKNLKFRFPKKFFDGVDWDRLMIAMDQIRKAPFDIADKSTITTMDIRATLMQERRKHPDEPILVIIDYLQLMTGDKSENRTQEVSKISRELKEIARDLKVTIMALSQLSRKVEERADKKPLMSDIRESGSIEQDADIVAFLYREEYYDANTELKGIVEVIIGKQRNGPTGSYELAFLKEYSKMKPLPEGSAETP